ncbi:MAG: class I SAM-dependent methyltransferase [Phycisphaerae bacterium]|nr:class I SAM-dependent methyltransferase [Phycisphaerae bacterium]
MAATTKPRLLTRPCPLCKQTDYEAYLTAGDTTFGFPGTFHVVRCRLCTMLFTNPQVAPEDLPAYYPKDYAAHVPERAVGQRSNARGRDAWDRLPEIGRKRLLDVGCGSGAYMLRKKVAGWTVYGVDPAEGAVLAARRQGLQVVRGAIPGVALPEREFEVITMLAVLDHVPDPLATVRDLRRRLASGGRLIVSVPNAESAAARLFGADWPGWDLPRHQNHFTAATLTEILRHGGFADVELHWKRRTTRWQRGARLRARSDKTVIWRLLARSRNLCSALARLRSRGTSSDEIVAVART